MKTILIHFMNVILAAILFLLSKQLAPQINLKKVHFFSTQIKS